MRNRLETVVAVGALNMMACVGYGGRFEEPHIPADIAKACAVRHQKITQCLENDDRFMIETVHQLISQGFRGGNYPLPDRGLLRLTSVNQQDHSKEQQGEIMDPQGQTHMKIILKNRRIIAIYKDFSPDHGWMKVEVSPHLALPYFEKREKDPTDHGRFIADTERIGTYQEEQAQKKHTAPFTPSDYLELLEHTLSPPFTAEKLLAFEGLRRIFEPQSVKSSEEFYRPLETIQDPNKVNALSFAFLVKEILNDHHINADIVDETPDIGPDTPFSGPLVLWIEQKTDGSLRIFHVGLKGIGVNGIVYQPESMVEQKFFFQQDFENMQEAGYAALEAMGYPPLLYHAWEKKIPAFSPPDSATSTDPQIHWVSINNVINKSKTP